jgi:hypothetical protein
LAEEDLKEDDPYPGLPLAKNHSYHIFLLPDICDKKRIGYVEIFVIMQKY